MLRSCKVLFERFAVPLDTARKLVSLTDLSQIFTCVTVLFCATVVLGLWWAVVIYEHIFKTIEIP